MAMKKNNTSKHKIYERNPNTGVIRWRYVVSHQINLVEQIMVEY